MTRRTLLLTVSVATFLLGIWAGLFTFQRPPYVGIELLSNGTIHHVDPQGPAARAGVQLGDLVRTVDGRPLLESITLLHGKSTGQEIVLDGYRGSEHFGARVVLDDVTPREFVFSLERLFVGLMFWIVGVGIWLTQPVRPSVELFLVASLVTAVMLFGEVLDPSIPSMSVLTDFSRYLIGPLLLHFFASFPTPIPNPYRKTLLRAVYGAYIVIALVFGAAIVRALDLYVSGLWLAPRVYEGIVGILVVAALVRPQPAASLNAQRWRGILIAGMLVGIMPVMVTILSMVVNGGRPLVPYEWTVPALALTPLSYGYAVYKSELGKAGFVLNRSLVYFLLTWLLLAFYALLYLGIATFFAADEGWGHLIAGVVIVLSGSTLFVPLRTHLQQRVDRLFYGGWYDYRSFVQSVTSRLSRYTDIEELGDQLRSAAQRMRFTSGVLLWPREDVFRPVGAYEVSIGELHRLALPVASAIPDALRAVGGPCTRSELSNAVRDMDLTVTERRVLATTSFHYWLPLISRGTLRSILIAGERPGGEELDADDRAIVETLSTQAAIACDNIALLESLQSRLEEVERVRDDLAEAQMRLSEGREDERKHLARELHDGPIQDLYAMLHEVERLSGHDRDEMIASRVTLLREKMRQVAGTLRDICLELRPPLVSDVGLDVTLRSYSARVQARYPDVTFELDLIPMSDRLHERVHLALFRVCQEAVSNALQHGRPGRIRVHFESDAEGLLLEIEDDGCGFTVPDRWISFGRQGHLGLLGIAERAQSIGGVLDVKSEPGRGTIVRVMAPWADDAFDSIQPARAVEVR